MKYLWLFAALVAALGIASCKQGKGERCQIQDDCNRPLICNQATNTCVETAGGQIDATVPKMDAGVDAPHDAPRD